MKPILFLRSVMPSLSIAPLFAGLAVAGSMLLLVSTPASAQSTNMAELRDLRVACLESFSTARGRLDELHSFVAQQAERERAASDRLFELQRDAASAKRRNVELQQDVRRCSNGLARAQKAIEQATTSYRTAVDSMPAGDDWAKDGSAALSELRRAADAAPQDMWKHKRYKEIQAEFVTTLGEWRAAKRSMEQASFDLEMRAAPDAFKQTTKEIEAATKELKTVESQLADREAVLGKLTSQSDKWGAAIRALREEEAKSREHLASISFKFHLVDLKLAAWRLKHSSLEEEDVEMLPDALEQALEREAAKLPGYVTPLPGADSSSVGTDWMSSGGVPEPRQEEPVVDRDDPNFRKLLARVLLAQSRLRFLSNVLSREFISVHRAINSLEGIEEQSRELTDGAARLAADQESLRRSVEAEQQTLAKGTATLDLVKKRFAADHKAINDLLETASQRTGTLAKRLVES